MTASNLPSIPDSSLLPAEYVVDKYSPAGDKFFKRLGLLKKHIMAATGELTRSRHLEVVRLHHIGKSTKEIGELTGYRATSIYPILNSAPAERLLALMQMLRLEEEGPLDMQRKALLWRIAVDNEKDKPDSAIRAVGEINRMNGVGVKGGDSLRSLTVVVNNQVLAVGPLDK
jgi:hypothetical protein